MGPVLTIGAIIALFVVLGAPAIHAGISVLVAVALGFVVWRLSLVFGPSKVCRRCKGGGSVGGLLGGKRKCSSCGGSGLRPRVGSGGC
jgi:nitrate reductase NapE component